MKLLIVAIVIFLLWIWSYIKFKRKMNYFSIMTAYLQDAVRSYSTPNKMLRLACALMEIQQYKEAYEIYSQVLRDNPSLPEKEKVLLNIDFCKSPIPGINTPKNIHSSWWHNFVLVRLGRKRYIFLEDDDFLKTNSLLRNM